jgi:hypothetical protein
MCLLSASTRKLLKLTKTFSGGTAGDARDLPLSLAEEGRAKVTGFQAYIPLIAAVCNPGLRERHWATMADVVGFEIKQDEVGRWMKAGPSQRQARLVLPCSSSSILSASLNGFKTAQQA